MPVKNEIRYNRIQKMLMAKIQDPAWMTAFQPMVIAELITSIYKMMDPDKKIKFQYYKKGSEEGFASVPDKEY